MSANPTALEAARGAARAALPALPTAWRTTITPEITDAIVTAIANYFAGLARRTVEIEAPEGAKITIREID
jgi:hypothetical protein